MAELDLISTVCCYVCAAFLATDALYKSPSGHSVGLMQKYKLAFTLKGEDHFHVEICASAVAIPSHIFSFFFVCVHYGAKCYKLFMRSDFVSDLKYVVLMVISPSV